MRPRSRVKQVGTQAKRERRDGRSLALAWVQVGPRAECSQDEMEDA
jgi:hypothetical protein